MAASLNRINIISLINLSTTIIIKSNIIFVISSFDNDSLITKFIDIELYNLLGICNSYNNLYSLYWDIFVL